MDFSLSQIASSIDWNDVTTRLIRIVVILIGGTTAYLALRIVRRRVSQMGAGGATLDEGLQRRKTLASVITTAGLIAIVSITFMMVLHEVGIALGPLLATAGVASLAIGFGAQTLVKDVISGFFILLEDQYSIGDAVEAGGVSGVVEEVHLRTTILRDVHGTVHVVPNGEIRVLSNKTKEWSRAVLEIGISYGEDLDRVIGVLENIASEVTSDPVVGPLLLETPTVPGVEAFGDSAVVIRIMAKTVPLKQWDVARELRRRIKQRFDQEGIEIPFPQRTVWHRQEKAGGAGPVAVESLEEG